MSEQELEGQVLTEVPDERQAFIKRAVLERAFAEPIVASFEMDSLRMDSAAALTPNASR